MQLLRLEDNQKRQKRLILEGVQLELRVRLVIFQRKNCRTKTKPEFMTQVAIFHWLRTQPIILTLEMSEKIVVE